MDLQNFLIEALKERFKANAVVKELEKQIKEIAEQKTFEKYKDKPFFRYIQIFCRLFSIFFYCPFFCVCLNILRQHTITKETANKAL